MAIKVPKTDPEQQGLQGQARPTRSSLFEEHYNHIINKTRILVEHVIGRVKKFRIVSELFRNRRATHGDFFVTVTGLINFRALNLLY